MVDQQEAEQRPLGTFREFVGALISAGYSMAEAASFSRPYGARYRELISEGHSKAEAVELLLPELPPPSSLRFPNGDDMTFPIERDLQSALSSNIEQLEPGLTLAGTEVQTEAGRIDILARDGQGTAVVIELKAWTAPPESVAQILGYMGTFQEKGQSVRGILVAGDFHDRVKRAARAVPNLKLTKYSFKFTFSSVS